MARIRTIKPDYWTSGKQIRVCAEAALLNIALWNFADDDGRMNDDLDEIAARCPRRFRAAIHELLDELAEARLIVRYEAGSPRRRYIQVHDWDHHQRINRPRPSGIPAPIAEPLPHVTAKEMWPHLHQPDTSITLPADFQNAREVIRAMADPNLPYQEVPPTVAYIAPSDLSAAEVQEHLREPGKVEELTPQQIEDIRRFGPNPYRKGLGESKTELSAMAEKAHLTEIPFKKADLGLLANGTHPKYLVDESTAIHGTVTEPSLNLNEIPNNIVSESSVTTHGALTEDSLGKGREGKLKHGMDSKGGRDLNPELSTIHQQSLNNHGGITEPSVKKDVHNPNHRNLDEFGLQVYNRYIEKFGKEDLDPIFYGRIAMYLRRLGPECVTAALTDTLAARSGGKVQNPKGYVQTLLKRDLDAQIKGN